MAKSAKSKSVLFLVGEEPGAQKLDQTVLATVANG